MDADKRNRLVSLVVRERLSVRKAADAIGVSHMTAYRALAQARLVEEAE